MSRGLGDVYKRQANATNSVKLRELMEKQENCATELEEKEERWMYLNELAEQMGL